jgi:hypothetical protein
VLIKEADKRKDGFSRRESLGPELFTSVLNNLGLPLDMGGTPDTFYPIRFIENFKLWLPEFKDEVRSRTKAATFLPIYQSFPSRLGFSNDRLPPKGSYLRKALGKYAPAFNHHPAYSADDFRTAVRRWFHANPAFIPPLRSVSGPSIERWLETGVVGRRRKTRPRTPDLHRRP